MFLVTNAQLQQMAATKKNAVIARICAKLESAGRASDFASGQLLKEYVAAAVNKLTKAYHVQKLGGIYSFIEQDLTHKYLFTPHGDAGVYELLECADIDERLKFTMVSEKLEQWVSS